ncbi:MAG: serine hydrolase domain-containing protein [Prochlorococcaceae cyanobacterium]|jgi:CubicO group peptidase (beta-lactamase class C family)
MAVITAPARCAISQEQFNGGKQILIGFIHGFTLPVRSRQAENGYWLIVILHGGFSMKQHGEVALQLPARAGMNRGWFAQRARHVLGGVLVFCLSGAGPVWAMKASEAAAADSPQAAAILRIVRNRMAVDHLRAVIVRVTIDGIEAVTEAMGESMTGMPATEDMHFRNGAVAISYVATLLLQLVDENKVRLDDKLSTWLPDIPNADRVTLGQLAQMTSGYRDYVIGNDAFNQAQLENPSPCRSRSGSSAP